MTANMRTEKAPLTIEDWLLYIVWEQFYMQ